MFNERPTLSVDTGDPRRAKSYSRIIGAFIAVAAVSLVILDILSPPGPPLSNFVGSLVYGGKTALGAMVTILGFYALFRARLPILFRISVILYTCIVICWFLIWLMGVRNNHLANSSILTYVFNPTYSIWSWLFILLIPLVATLNRNGQISNALGRIPLVIGLALLLVPTIGLWLFHWNVNTSNSGIFMLLLLAMRYSPSRLVKASHFFIALIVCIAMIVTDYRIYAIGSLVFALNLYIPKSKILFTSQYIFLSLTPILFHFIITNYAESIVSSDNPILFDTRSFLFEEMIDDFSYYELLTGRGFDGSYYSPYFAYVAKHFAADVGLNNVWRTTSEIGWLNIILHFGLFGLIPFYIGTFSPAIFHSRNRSEILQIDGVYCLLPVISLLFAGELWSAINITYFSWYVALGILLTNRPMHIQPQPPT